MSPTVTIEPGLEPFVERAIADLANRLSVETSVVEVIHAEAVVWSDASLGCPQPGMAYLQVPEDGVLIRLRVESQVYNYHGGGFDRLFLCEQTLTATKETIPKLDEFVPTADTPDN